MTASAESGADAARGIYLSGEELTVLAELLGVPPPPGAPAPAASTPDSEPAAWGAQQAALRSLLAHGAVQVTDGRVEMPGTLEAVVRTAAEPTVRAAVIVVTDESTELRYLAASPFLAVEHHFESFGTHVLRPFEPRAFSSEVAACAGWSGPDTVVGSLFEVSFAQLHRLLTEASSGRPHEADGPWSAEPARSFAPAATNAMSSGTVTLARRPAESMITGKILTWINGGEHGLWSMTPPAQSPWNDAEGGELSPAAERLPVWIEPVGVAQLIAEIEDSLPDDWPGVRRAGNGAAASAEL